MLLSSGRREKQTKTPDLCEIWIRMLPSVRKRKLTAVGPTPSRDENETAADDINNALQLWALRIPQVGSWLFLIPVEIQTWEQTDASGQLLHLGEAGWVFFFGRACNPWLAAESLSPDTFLKFGPISLKSRTLFFRAGCPLVVEMSAHTWEEAVNAVWRNSSLKDLDSKVDDSVQSVFREEEIVEKKHIQIFGFFFSILLMATFHPQLRMWGYLILQGDSIHFFSVNIQYSWPGLILLFTTFLSDPVISESGTNSSLSYLVYLSANV